MHVKQDDMVYFRHNSREIIQYLGHISRMQLDKNLILDTRNGPLSMSGIIPENKDRNKPLKQPSLTLNPNL